MSLRRKPNLDITKPHIIFDRRSRRWKVASNPYFVDETMYAAAIQFVFKLNKQRKSNHVPSTSTSKSNPSKII